MRFPEELFTAEERPLVTGVLDLFRQRPLVLTDRLTNSIYLNPPAEELFGLDGESIVNRAAYSLLGFGESDKLPLPVADALLGDTDAWRSLVTPPGGHPVFCEASCVRIGDAFVAGLLRFEPRA